MAKVKAAQRYIDSLTFYVMPQPLVKAAGAAEVGRWSVRIMGDLVPLESGLSRAAASRLAVEMMLDLSSGVDEWDCHCNLDNGERAYVLFRCLSSDQERFNA